MKVRDVLGIPERRQRQVTRAMQVSLVGFFFVGLYELSLGVMINSGLGILVTQLPAIIKRDYDITVDPAIALWITGAVFLHALGVVGLPGMQSTFYQSIWWWDHLTHGLSSTVVAGAGYAIAKTFDRHGPDLYLPPQFMFVFTLLVVLAAGVFWEVVEFAVSGVASFLGSDAVLTQYGVDDTLLDLVFNSIGGILVATLGVARLEALIEEVRSRLDGRHAGD